MRKFIVVLFFAFTFLIPMKNVGATNHEGMFHCVWDQFDNRCEVGDIECGAGHGTVPSACSGLNESQCLTAINIACTLQGPTPPPPPSPNDPDGQGESRVWFPHLRLIATLSTIAQSMINPHPSSLSNNAAPSDKTPSLENKGIVTSKIEKWQGISDDTPVVNNYDNNSSLIVGQNAPDANFLLEKADEYNEAQCYVPETINNPGDDLVGPKITGRVTYTNKFEYQALPITATGAGDVKLEAKGRINPFLKVPLIEYVYDVIVHGEDSLFNRFMPSDQSKDIKEIPSSVAYIASAQSTNGTGPVKTIEYGQANSPTLYVPHVGSLKKYWLEDLQKALRPGGITSGTNPTNPNQPTAQCIAPDPDSPELTNIITIAGPSTAKVPISVLRAIYSIEGLTAYSSPENYNCQKNSFTALGLMQITDGIIDDVTSPSERADGEPGNCAAMLGKLNRCHPESAMELAARVLLFKVGQWPNGQITSQNQVRRASCGYYGSDQPDIYTQNFAKGHFDESQCRGRDCDNMSYADIVCLSSGFCDGNTWPRRLGDNPDTEREEACAS